MKGDGPSQLDRQEIRTLPTLVGVRSEIGAPAGVGGSIAMGSARRLGRWRPGKPQRYGNCRTPGMRPKGRIGFEAEAKELIVAHATWRRLSLTSIVAATFVFTVSGTAHASCA